MPTAGSTPVPEAIAKLEQHWLSWLDYLTLCISLDFSALPFTAMQRGQCYPINAADAIESLFSACVRLAVADLSEVITQVDDDGYRERFCGPSVVSFAGRDARRDIFDMDHIARARTFSPAAVYRAIVADHSPSDVTALENLKLATSIYSAFSMARSPIALRAGCVVMTLQAWSEKDKWRSGINYGYSQERSTFDAVNPLITLLRDRLDRPGWLSGAQESLSSVFRYNDRGIESRHRMTLTPDVTLVFYAKKIEVLVSADVAARLNAFLGEWLPSSVEAA